MASRGGTRFDGRQSLGRENLAESMSVTRPKLSVSFVLPNWVSDARGKVPGFLVLVPGELYLQIAVYFEP